MLTIARGVFNASGFADKRGGRRVREEFVLKEAAVKAFIEKLKVTESHYGRGQSKRLYLSADLNTKKVWQTYNAQAQDDVKVQPCFVLYY